MASSQSISLNPLQTRTIFHSDVFCIFAHLALSDSAPALFGWRTGSGCCCQRFHWRVRGAGEQGKVIKVRVHLSSASESRAVGEKHWKKMSQRRSEWGQEEQTRIHFVCQGERVRETENSKGKKEQRNRQLRTDTSGREQIALTAFRLIWSPSGLYQSLTFTEEAYYSFD